MKRKRGDNVNKQKLKKIILTVVLISAAVFLCLLLLGTFAQAAGLVDDTVSEDNLYSKYALDHYQLDFMWIQVGIGYRGTGMMELGNKSCMGSTRLPILSGL